MGFLSVPNTGQSLTIQTCIAVYAPAYYVFPSSVPAVAASHWMKEHPKPCIDGPFPVVCLQSLLRGPQKLIMPAGSLPLHEHKALLTAIAKATMTAQEEGSPAGWDCKA